MATEPEPEGSYPRQAEARLDAARLAGDVAAEASALTDLGALLVNEGAAPRAFPVLTEAVELARRLGDRAAESDAESELGRAALALGQGPRAVELFQRVLTHARTAGDPIATKTALFHLGLAWSTLGDAGRALGLFDEAVAVARRVGDRQHEADLLWHQGIILAETGRRDEALARGQAAVNVLEKMGSPRAAWFADHLARYRRAEPDVHALPPLGFGGSISVGPWTAPTITSTDPIVPPSGPGPLRMAFSAAKAMARFIGSGFAVVGPEAVRARLDACDACEHHTGSRCKVCV